jgi:ethanolamine utilization protein EutA (predicted chaperonin)
LKENEDKIEWLNLSENVNAIDLLKENQDKIDWDVLSLNKNAIHLLEANYDKINWMNLSENKNAIHLLEANPEKINWMNLSENKNAIELLKNNRDKIYWYNISYNPSIFEFIKQFDSNYNIIVHTNGDISSNEFSKNITIYDKNTNVLQILSDFIHADILIINYSSLSIAAHLLAEDTQEVYCPQVAGPTFFQRILPKCKKIN